MESPGEKHQRLKAQREQVTRLAAELSALGYATAMFTRKGATVLKCAKGLGSRARGAVLTWDAEGFTGRIIRWKHEPQMSASVTDVMGKLKFLSDI